MDCKFEFLYYTTHPDNSIVELHKHNCYELVYYLNGTGNIIIDDVCYKYSKNTFSITVPEKYHEEEHLKQTDVLFIGFSTDSNLYHLNDGIYFDNEQFTFLKHLEEMKWELTNKRNFYSSKLNMVTNEIAIEFSRMNENNEHSFPRGLSYIEKFISENSSQDINLKTLAELSGYSYDHFRHLFKQETGYSPINYIILKRIENAKKLLTGSNLKISNISMECGFSSESLFCSMFRKYTGLTPGTYRINSMK